MGMKQKHGFLYTRRFLTKYLRTRCHDTAVVAVVVIDDTLSVVYGLKSIDVVSSG